MELNNLIQKAWHLQGEINERIHQESVSFCKHCFDHHGLVCTIPEAPEEAEERRRLIPIRDSLKEIQDMLVFLQVKESIKQQEQNAAFDRLETSRLELVERIKQHPRKVEVLEELNDWFGDGKFPEFFTWKLMKQRKKEKNGVFRSFVGRICSLFRPRNWFNTVRTAMVLVVLYAGVSSTMNGYNRGILQGNVGLQRRIVLVKDGKLDDDVPTGQIGVLCGRG